MGISLRNSAEGVAVGTSITTGGNTGGASGNALTVARSGGSLIFVDDAHFSHGSRSYKFDYSASVEQQSYVRWVVDPSPSASIRGYLHYDSLPASGQYVADIRKTPSGAMIYIMIQNGKLRVLNSVGGDGINGTYLLPASTPPLGIRIAAYALPGTTTTDGFFEVKLWSEDGTTELETITRSNYNTGTTQPVEARFGRTSPLTSAWSFWWDDLAVQTDYPALLPAYGVNTPPSVVADGAKTGVEPWSAVAHTGTVYDGETFVGGTVQWSLLSTNPSGLVVPMFDADTDTLIYEAPGSVGACTVTLGFTATDASGAVSNTAVVTDSVLPPTDYQPSTVGGPLVPLRLTAPTPPEFG